MDPGQRGGERVKCREDDTYEKEFEVIHAMEVAVCKEDKEKQKDERARKEGRGMINVERRRRSVRWRGM